MVLPVCLPGCNTKIQAKLASQRAAAKIHMMVGRAWVVVVLLIALGTRTLSSRSRGPIECSHGSTAQIVSLSLTA